MADRDEKLKIKTVDGSFGDDGTFSPEEMHPFEVAEALESDLIAGKTAKQVKKARKLFGANDVKSEFSLSFTESLKNQLRGMTGIFLMLASIIMYIFRRDEPIYLVMAFVVAGIIFMNAFAEFRASKALRLPKKYSSLKARVIRDGVESVIDSRQLVPGDLIFVEEGMMVPADCRIVDSFNLTVIESHVSGVFGSVEKSGKYIAADGIEPICMNMIYAGSIIASGHASAIVCRIGGETLTRRGKAKKGREYPEILRYVSELSKFLSIASVVISFLLLIIGVAAGADITKWFVCALAIGASSLCDSMLSVCSASLGFGARQMAEDGMVLKNYGCVRTLSKVNTVMCGKDLAFPPKRIELTGLYFSCAKYDREKRPDDAATELLTLSLVCSDVRKVTDAEKKARHGLPEYIGNPLENAIVDYFGEWNRLIGDIREKYIKLDSEHTISGDVSRILTLHEGKNLVIVRGAPENVLSRCIGYTLEGKDYKLSDFTRKKILAAMQDYARTSSFIIAVASGNTEADSLRDISAEQKLIFKGFIAFSSSLDPGVASAVYTCENAGIETVLSTNDAYYTAFNAAKSAGIINDETQMITAEQFRSCSQGLLIANCPYYRVFLNIDDGEWLDILKMRKESGKTVAVTAERISELPLMNEAGVSIVPERSSDTLRQSADALLLGSGINLIADGILNAKTICRRIGSVVKYVIAAITMMSIASVFAACYDQTPVLRAQDVMFGGLIFNIAFSFALAFEPRNVKNLKSKFTLFKASPTLADFVYPLMYSVGAGIILFVIFAVTGSYTCSLISLTSLLFLHACTATGHGGPFKTGRFGNKILWLCGLGAALTILFLIFTKLGHKLGYGVPALRGVIIAIALSFGYAIAMQIGRFFFSLTNKERKARKESAEKKKADKQKRKEEKANAESKKFSLKGLFAAIKNTEKDESENEEAAAVFEPEEVEEREVESSETHEAEAEENDETAKSAEREAARLEKERIKAEKKAKKEEEKLLKKRQKILAKQHADTIKFDIVKYEAEMQNETERFKFSVGDEDENDGEENGGSDFKDVKY